MATLCTIKLLQRLSPEQYNAVSCIGFATPALSNEALAALATEHGWDKRIKNYLVPEDPIPGLLSAQSQTAQTQTQPSSSNMDTNNIAATAADAAAATLANTNNSSNSTSDNNTISGPSSSSPSISIHHHTDGLTTTNEAGISIEEDKSNVEVTALSSSTSSIDSSDTSIDAAKVRDQPPGVPATGQGQKSGGGMRRSLSKNALRVVDAVAGRPARLTGNILNKGLRIPLEIAAMPINAARPKYRTIGQQLYVHQDAVQKDKPSQNAPPPPMRRSLSTTTVVVDGSTSMTSTRVDDSATIISQQESKGQGPGGVSWLNGFKFGFSHKLSSGSFFLPPSGDGDDDNVDVAAAAAAAGGLVPDRLPARTLFPMHRMLTYRTRLLNICEDALMGHHWPHSILPPALPHLPNFPHPDDVTPSELLAPAMFPLKAEATPVRAKATETHTKNSSVTSSEMPLSLIKTQQPAVVIASRRQAPWPIRWIFRGQKQADDTEIETIVRIEGRGLCNVTAAWISGANRDAAGKATPVGLQIMSLPSPPVPSQSMRKPPSPLWGPLAALASWLAMAVGAVGILRQLQPAGQADYLLAKVKLPAGTVRAAQRAAVDPLAAAVGEGPKLMVHLQSDFAVHSLPLTVMIPPSRESSHGGGRNSGKGGDSFRFWNQSGRREEQQGGIIGHAVPAAGVTKDANRVLRSARLRGGTGVRTTPPRR